MHNIFPNTENSNSVNPRKTAFRPVKPHGLWKKQMQNCCVASTSSIQTAWKCSPIHTFSFPV